jgi:hypothetical protein
MWHPLATHRVHVQRQEELESLAHQRRAARELSRSYAVVRAREEHPSLFLQPRAPSHPEAA